jgi:hypothetical protein
MCAYYLRLPIFRTVEKINMGRNELSLDTVTRTVNDEIVKVKVSLQFETLSHLISYYPVLTPTTRPR